MEPKRCILLAVNGSEHSNRAFDYCLNKLVRPGDQLLLFHVVDTAKIPPPTFAHGPSHSTEEWDHMMQRLNEEAKTVTAQYEKRCSDEKLPFETLSAVGSVGEAVCETAKKMEADLVVIGNRGLGSIRRTFLGSVSDYVVQHSDIPTLVVPPPQ